MNTKIPTISACLVIYNEALIIRRCLESVKDLVDEIVVIHDGECTDGSLDIVREYTDRIFIRPHTGDSSLHRVFSYEQARSEWIFQIDADEYLDIEDHLVIKRLVQEAEGTDINCYNFQWEMWNLKKSIYVKGFQKDCLFKKNHFHYLSITHGWAYVDGKTIKSGLRLHHRPAYNNIGWKAFFRKAKRWVPIHATFFFPNSVRYEGFNINPDKWISFTEKVRRHILWHLLWEPIKMCVGQLRNGLYTSRYGWQAALQQYVYYFYLYSLVWRLKRKQK